MATKPLKAKAVTARPAAATRARLGAVPTETAAAETAARARDPIRRSLTAAQAPQPNARTDDALQASTFGTRLELTAEEIAKENNESVVQVQVPNAFMLTDDQHRQIEYTPETDRMPKSHAEHWYSKAQGVRIRK